MTTSYPAESGAIAEFERLPEHTQQVPRSSLDATSVGQSPQGLRVLTLTPCRDWSPVGTWDLWYLALGGVTSEGSADEGTVFAFEALDAIELGEQLVDNAVSDASRIVAALRRDGVELIEEQDARRGRSGSPAQGQGVWFSVRIRARVKGQTAFRIQAVSQGSP